MGYYRQYDRKNDKWYALGFITFFGVLTGLALYFGSEYSEENILKRQEQHRTYIWPTEQSYVPETKLDIKDTTTIKDTLFNKDTIDNKLK